VRVQVASGAAGSLGSGSPGDGSGAAGSKDEDQGGGY